MRRRNKLLLWTMAGIMGVSTPMTALAVSPEFARTAEEWARLQDDVLEYEEIADLIEEYNVTVQNNQYDYNQFVKDYGRKKDDVAQAYRELADELEGNISGDDSAGAMVSDLQLEQQAAQLREQADDNVEDSQIYAWTYGQAKASLVLSAKEKYISYFKNQLELESAGEELKVLQSALTLAQVQRQAGTATESDVLTAEEKVLKQEKTIAGLQQTIEGTREKLVVMLGWKSSDNPQISGTPEPDMGEIEAINLEADKQTALAKNYTLLSNQRKLENASDSANKQKLQNTVNGNEKQIAVSVTEAWQNLQTSKRSYEQAAADASAEEKNMALTQKKWEAGLITQYEYEKQSVSLSGKNRAVRTASLDLLNTLEIYYANVNGLAEG